MGQSLLVWLTDGLMICNDVPDTVGQSGQVIVDSANYMYTSAHRKHRTKQNRTVIVCQINFQLKSVTFFFVMILSQWLHFYGE